MKESSLAKMVNVIIMGFILALCVVTIYPYLNQFAISINQGMDTNLGGITIFPRKFTLANYKAVFGDPKIYLAAVVTVTRVIIGVVSSIIITFGAAYALTRRNLAGRQALTLFLCIPMYLSAGIIPVYLVMRYLGLINNYLVYIFPLMFSFYNMVIIRSFIQEIPESLEESALLDGANELQIMFKIIIPLSKPVLATVALWVAVSHWNDWMSTLLYVTDAKLYTLQYITMKIIKQGETLRNAAMEQAMGNDEMLTIPTEEAVKSAVLMVTTIPIIIVYPFLQKYFVKGVTLGAVKG